MPKPVFIIAEAGVNHNGSVELALELVRAAAKTGADAVKFQTFKADELVTKAAKTAEYQQETTGEKNQYEMLKKLMLTEADYDLLVAECEKQGIEFMSTPFDFASAQFLQNLGVKRLKVPSGELNNLPLLEQLTGLNLPIILSTGMGSLDEVLEAVEFMGKVRQNLGFSEPLEDMLTVLHCTSNYPAKPEDVNLKAMQTMAKALGKVPVGYSDHTLGGEVSIASVAMGATVIEKHMTLDKNMPGPDHRASMEPDEFTAMVTAIRNIEKAFGDGVKQPTASELPVRDIARRSLTLKKSLTAGASLTLDDLAIMRPGTGIPPKALKEVVGRKLAADKPAGTTLTWDMLA